MIETKEFFNAGYGWVCKHCTQQDEESNLSSKGEDNHSIKHSPISMAQWLDEKRRVLYCPRCGAQEEIDKT